jgi:hypothetical protein
MPSYRSSEPTARPDFVEPGEYTVEVVNAEETVSQKGSDMIELKLRVQPSGATMFDHLVFMESAFWKIDSFRAATGESITPDEEVDINADDLIGRTGRARLTVEEFNGRKRNKIAAWLPPKPAMPAPAAAAAAAATATAKPKDDDNIPF